MSIAFGIVRMAFAVAAKSGRTGHAADIVKPPDDLQAESGRAKQIPDECE
jgi:hypothetical protein